MIIRQTRPSDYKRIYEVVKKAFAGAEYSDGNEQELVAALRESKAYIPELSLLQRWKVPWWDIFFLQKQRWESRRFWLWRLFLFFRNTRRGE